MHRAFAGMGRLLAAAVGGLAGLFAGAHANIPPLDASLTNAPPMRGRAKRRPRPPSNGRWRRIQQWAFGRRDFDGPGRTPGQNKRLKAAAVKSCARGIARAHGIRPKPATLARIERRVRRTWS